jgi:hypothetical protein
MRPEARPGDRKWWEALTFALATLWRDRPDPPAVPALPAADEAGLRDDDEAGGDDGFPGWDAMILALLA